MVIYLFYSLALIQLPYFFFRVIAMDDSTSIVSFSLLRADEGVNKNAGQASIIDF